MTNSLLAAKIFKQKRIGEYKMNYLKDNVSGPLKWPYPVDYDKENRIDVDVLVIGGSFAGCCAGISAARRGASVAVIDKAPMERSGSGGAGIDHWNSIFENPKSPWTTEEIIEKTMDMGVHSLGHRDYIAMKGTWDALLELEKMGLPIRDEDDEFEGSASRDEDSKLLKSYNYRDMISVKLRGGHFVKPVIFHALRSLKNVQTYSRLMATMLLTENGVSGGRVIGACAFSLETGEFYIFHAKSVIIATGYVKGSWLFNTELAGSAHSGDPNDVGEGFAMAWKAGAEIYGMDQNGAPGGWGANGWPNFGSGNCTNTWYPCNIADEEGRQIPWADVNGDEVTEFEKRNEPAPGQHHMGVSSSDKMPGIDTPDLIKDLGRRIKAGEYDMPLWADLPSVPEDERRSIWGMMVGNEGKTRYPVFDYYTRWGFDPDKDELIGSIVSPADVTSTHGWISGEPGEADRVSYMRTETRSNGNIATDWNQMSSVPGLFAAGAACGVEGCSFACSSGFYTGNRAYEYSEKVENGELDEDQIRAEKKRVYAPVKRSKDPENYVSWKELWAGTARVMQSCCGKYLTEPILEYGLFWLESIEEYEMQLTYARNPHELARVMECETRMTTSKSFIQCALAEIRAKKDSDTGYEVDPYSGDIRGAKEKDRDLYIFHKMQNGEVERVVREGQYWLEEPYASSYLENYTNCRKGEMS